MTPERWQLIARTYEAAVDLDPAARDRFPSEACERDRPLRQEVESLLRHDGADVVVDRPVLATAVRCWTTPTPWCDTRYLPD